MKLSKFDGLRVRVTTVWGDVIDGICQHNSAEYNEHEFGPHEEGLQFPSLLLYKRDIKKVRLLKDGFPTPFGKLEELAVEDGADIIEEVFLCEEDEHILRLLRCLEQQLDPAKQPQLPEREEILDLIRQLHKYTHNPEIMEKADRLLQISGCAD